MKDRKDVIRVGYMWNEMGIRVMVIKRGDKRGKGVWRK